MGHASSYHPAPRRRTPSDVLSDHLRKLQEGHIEEDIYQNYAEDVVVLSGGGIHRGHRGARRAALVLRKVLPGVRMEIRNRVVEGEYALVEWVGRTDGTEVLDGADSFVIRNGRIVAHTSHYTVQGPLRH
jgi:hypothetical protein